MFFAMVTTSTWKPAHPQGDDVPVFGICTNDCGHSCIEHTAMVSRCRWMWCFVFKGNKSASCVGRRLQCAVRLIVKDNINQCHVGLFRHSNAKFGHYNGACIQVVDVITPDDADVTRRTKFDCFHGWADVAIINVTHLPCSSLDSSSNK